ncbi:unnamed protein product [Mytilus edulis]|uniref:EF-hand domain-containing protein n=1 Tax=Mytilus edulis TaxID=6550 RepID=A0A8S3QZ66_MYTED|nr:unnamed protein product [Mytilus edulis]
MPKDILRAPALSTFYLHNCPIRKLDIEWPASTTLTSLSLKGLLIQEVPKEIAKLSELNDLNLDCNPIFTLPDELGHLKKLKHLSAKGIPWIPFEGKIYQMPKAKYQKWHAENPYIINYLSEKAVEDLFDKFDENNNNILDLTEVAKLNFEFLISIPRIGVNKRGYNTYGGVPPMIFKLKDLESLDLSYTAINCIPDFASELFNLQTLNLEHCPFLENVSGNVGLLPNLRSLHLNSCAMLDSPPPDIVGRGFDSVRAFLKKMAGGFTECHRTKLMFIGLGQAGKTT